MSATNEQNLKSKALALASSIQSATDCVSRLITLLEQEREALSLGDTDALDRCGKEKADCVVDLETLDRQRALLCRELALDSADIDDFLLLNETRSAKNMWQTFVARLEQCKEANAVNGAFTRIRRGHVEKALHILRGAPQALALYGPDGLSEKNEVSNLGSA